MASREVILREDVPNLGHTGDVVRVRPGYARNFLLPRGLAVDASHRNLRMLAHEKRVLATRAAHQQQAAEGVRTKLDGLAVTIRALAGETGRLFGSVTNLDIERLLSERGFSVDRRRILLPDPIKDLGTHAVAVQIAGKVRATIQVTVEAETPADTPDA
jgi:large subunit ribosomal protein L9